MDARIREEKRVNDDNVRDDVILCGERKRRASVRWSGERLDEEFSFAFLIFKIGVTV